MNPPTEIEIAEVLNAIPSSLQAHDVIRRLAFQRDLLLQAIRKHRDQRGDDRCWMDDEDLYRVLPEGYIPPERDTTVELEHCKRFIECRRNPGTIYVSPEREIECLRELARELWVSRRSMAYSPEGEKLMLQKYPWIAK